MDETVERAEGAGVGHHLRHCVGIAHVGDEVQVGGAAGHGGVDGVEGLLLHVDGGHGGARLCEHGGDRCPDAAAAGPCDHDNLAVEVDALLNRHGCPPLSALAHS